MAPPIYVKGGVWTNVEDQILRAAVSKYGLTQWARVASLLPKKTAKQAKARWNEYLNPTINRSEWSKEDDEKLLGLAKLLPHQWRSISSIMGRTATQCVERYQKLLEAALKSDDEALDNEDDLKLSGPGIETLPALGTAYESLPSRPDMEDMDDDEREMLSEAKARLANTQGKKAKRKERERMLDESKRISLLQKRRELKAAGVNVSLELKNRKRRKEFDYNADIPHEHQPPPGLFEVAHEDETNDKEKTTFLKQVNVKGMSMKEVDDKHTKTQDDRAKQEAKRLRKEILAAAEIFSNLSEEQQIKRRRLDLPAPGEQEMEDVIENRILAKTIDLLPLSDSYLPQAALESQPKIPSSKHVKTEQKGPSKASKKVLTSIIHKALSGIPKPKNDVKVVLQQLDSNEEQLLSLVLAESDDRQTENLKILQQVELEKEKLRRSQVVQRGYDIPNPQILRLVPSTLQGLPKLIAEEALLLIRSDYTEFEDPSAGFEVVNTLDEHSYTEISKLVALELKSIKKADLHERAATSDEVLINSADIAEQVNNALDKLEDSASALEEAIQEDFNDYEEEVRDKYLQIQESYEEFAEADIEEKLADSIAKNELVAIDMRSARLHELVEQVTAAELRC